MARLKLHRAGTVSTFSLIWPLRVWTIATSLRMLLDASSVNDVHNTP